MKLQGIGFVTTIQVLAYIKKAAGRYVSVVATVGRKKQTKKRMKNENQEDSFPTMHNVWVLACATANNQIYLQGTTLSKTCTTCGLN